MRDERDNGGNGDRGDSRSSRPRGSRRDEGRGTDPLGPPCRGRKGESEK